MIFDKFCLLAEKHFPELKPLAEDAKLFIFDKPAHRYLKKDAGEEYAKYADIFALPFKITAIEDPASLIIFVDSEDDQIGFSKRRDFIEIMPWDQMKWDLEKKDYMTKTRKNLWKKQWVYAKKAHAQLQQDQYMNLF